MDIEEEKRVIEEARTNPLAFAKLYDTYYSKISNYLLHRLPRAEIAADITSDVFFKAMTKLHTYTFCNFPFSSWLYKIANNEVKMYYRRKERKFFSLEFLFDHYNFEPPDSTDIEQEYIAVEEELTRNKQFKDIQQILLTLALDYQEVLTLRYFEGKSLLEIAEITGKNLNTVKSLIARGKEKLRKEMAKKNGGEDNY